MSMFLVVIILLLDRLNLKDVNYFNVLNPPKLITSVFL